MRSWEVVSTWSGCFAEAPSSNWVLDTTFGRSVEDQSWSSFLRSILDTPKQRKAPVYERTVQRKEDRLTDLLRELERSMKGTEHKERTVPGYHYGGHNDGTISGDDDLNGGARRGYGYGRRRGYGYSS